MDEQVKAYFNKIIEHPKAGEILSALVAILEAVALVDKAENLQEQRMAQAAALNARGDLEEETGIADIRRARIIMTASGGPSLMEKVDQNLISRIFAPYNINTEKGQIEIRLAISQFFYDEKPLIDRKHLDESRGTRDSTFSMSGALAAHFLNAANGYSGTLARPEIIEDGSLLSPVDKQGKPDESGPTNFLRIRTVELLGYTCGFQKLNKKPQSILELAADFFNEHAKRLRQKGWKVRYIRWKTIRIWTSNTSAANHASLKAIFENARQEGLADAEANRPDASRLLGQNPKL